jgi:hypothetical protein
MANATAERRAVVRDRRQIDQSVRDRRPIDTPRLRAELAARRITYAALARSAGMNRFWVSNILSGYREPGELTRRRLLDGLRALGLGDVAEAAGLLDKGTRHAG